MDGVVDKPLAQGMIVRSGQRGRGGDTVGVPCALVAGRLAERNFVHSAVENNVRYSTVVPKRH